MAPGAGATASLLAPPRAPLHAACAYAICTNPRSGSWLLSEGLSSSGVAGHPREWFNVLEEHEQHAQWTLQSPADTSPRSYLAHVIGRGTTENGVFGVKLHYYQLGDLNAQLQRVDGYGDLGVEDAISTAFPDMRYIWLTRKDRARQAISYYRACQTGTWWEIESGKPPSDGASEPVFDPEAIVGLERLLDANDEAWQRFFARCGAQPLVIAYEDLSADYAGTIGKILTWLGIAGSAESKIPPPRLRRQADRLSEAWLDRYATFKAQRGREIPSSPANGRDTAAGSSRWAADPRSPVFALTRRAPQDLPPAWRQWVARALLQDVPHAVIAETMNRHGFDPGVVDAELREAEAHPYLQAGRESRAHLARGVRLLGALDRLERLQPWARAVPRESRPDRASFCQTYYAANRPVVLTNLMSDWAAMTRWTPAYLKSVLGDEEVEIMAERNSDPTYEVNAARHRRQVRFGDFVDMVYGGDPTNDYYLVANNQFFDRPRSQVLLEDFTPFDEYLDHLRLDGRCFFWFGPAGTVTPLHHDLCNILIGQVSGRKRFKLIPSTQWEHVFTGASCISDIDCERPDFVRRPAFTNATVLDVTLAPGEVLFIPVGWSHHVRALDPSISLSFTNFVFPNDYRW